MKKVLFSFIAVLLLAGGGAAYWFGNQPKKTYFPNGSVRTSVDQVFFKKTGEYKVFSADGILEQKYNVVEGVRNGAGFLNAGAVKVDVNYDNGNLSGKIKIDTNGKVPELDNLKINIKNNSFKVVYIDDAKKNADAAVDLPEAQISGKLVCNDDEFLDMLHAFLSQQTLDNFNHLGACVSITGMLLEDELYRCEFNGNYNYPKFLDNTKLRCESKGMDDMIAATFMDTGIPGIGKVSASLNYSAMDKKFSFVISDDKGLYNQIQTFDGLDSMITAVTEFTFSKQESQDIMKMISEVLKNFVISDSQLTVNNKVLSSVKGNFNFIDGFSNPWVASFFGLENTLTSQIKITNKGAVVNIAYPISQKPLLSAGIQINDEFKSKYKSFVELAMKEFSENQEDVAAEHIVAKLPEYSMAFSDFINSINALLMNNKGEKVLGAVLNVKKGIDFVTAAEDLNNAFTVKIISYKNNKPNKVISGDAENGFIADGQIISFEDIPDYLNKDVMNEVYKQIEQEFAQVYEIMKENKYFSDPFIKGFYEGYYNAMQQYKTGKVLDQISVLSANLRKVYVDSANYGNLNNGLALSLNTVPADMISENNAITDAFGGAVEISSSPAFEGDDENLAFVIKIKDIPQEACHNIATSEWKANSGIMGMGVNKNIDDLYLDETEDEKAAQCAEEGILCSIEHAMHISEAVASCKENGNTIYFKFQ